MKFQKILSVFLLLSLSACIDSGISPLGGSHTGNPDTKAYEDSLVASHCKWVDFCDSVMTEPACVFTQESALHEAAAQLKKEGYTVKASRYDNLSCSTVSGDFAQFKQSQYILNLWRNESFLQPAQ